MRVGLELEDNSCRSVVLDGRTVVHADAGAQASSLTEALNASLAGLRAAFGQQVTDITTNAGPVLRKQKLAGVLAIRISPRPPADIFHEIRLPPELDQTVVRAQHIRGGHDMRGRVLAPLGLETFIHDLPHILSGPVRSVAVTAVGATVTREHETQVADAILTLRRDMRISISNDFYSNAFRDRDYTAIINSALAEGGEELAHMLEAVGRRYFPEASFSFMKNDGGRAPVRRLAVMPVDGLYPEQAMHLLGAATLAGNADCEVVLCEDSGPKVGRMRCGLPAAAGVIRRGYEAGLASNTAITERYTADHPGRPDTSLITVDVRAEAHEPLPLGLVPSLPPGTETGLAGCAAAPLTAWIDRLERISDSADLQRVLQVAEEDAASAVVQLGAGPADVAIVESNVFTMPYGNPGIIRIRVQAKGQNEGTAEHAMTVTQEGVFR